MVPASSGFSAWRTTMILLAIIVSFHDLTENSLFHWLEAGLQCGFAGSLPLLFDLMQPQKGRIKSYSGRFDRHAAQHQNTASSRWRCPCGLVKIHSTSL